MFLTVTNISSHKRWAFVLMLTAFLTIGSVSARPLGPWPQQSSPSIMGKDFVKKMSELPTVGMATGGRKYWSSDYWAFNKGGINYRWNADSPNGFNLTSPDQFEASNMSLKKLETLAPSEKFDLFVGKYHYPLKQHVAKRASPQRRNWEGICNGWAAANLNHQEPTPKLMINPDGLKIPFGSSDIKALLSYYYAYFYRPNSTHQVGRRCNGQNYCHNDLNAGAFHIILSNKLGLKGKSFIADIDNGREVWNQVAFSYRTEMINGSLPPLSTSAQGTIKRMRIKTIMRVVFNIVENKWETVIGTPYQTYRDEEYEYDLEINSKGFIIGGEWISKKRPDFLWEVSPAIRFDGIFSRLNELLNDKGTL